MADDKPTQEEAELHQALDVFEKSVGAGHDANAPTGACLYIAGGKVRCAVVTEAVCNGLPNKQSWSEGDSCP